MYILFSFYFHWLQTKLYQNLQSTNDLLHFMKRFYNQAAKRHGIRLLNCLHKLHEKPKNYSDYTHSILVNVLWLYIHTNYVSRCSVLEERRNYSKLILLSFLSFALLYCLLSLNLFISSTNESESKTSHEQLNCGFFFFLVCAKLLCNQDKCRQRI